MISTGKWSERRAGRDAVTTMSVRCLRQAEGEGFGDNMHISHCLTQYYAQTCMRRIAIKLHDGIQNGGVQCDIAFIALHKEPLAMLTSAIIAAFAAGIANMAFVYVIAESFGQEEDATGLVEAVPAAA